MNLPLKTAALWCGLLLCGWARAEEPACERFQQKYAKQYTLIKCIDNDTAWVMNHQLQDGVTDSRNRVLIPFGTYDQIAFSAFSHNGKLLLGVRHQGKEGVIDRNNKLVLPLQYDGIVIPQKAGEPIIIRRDGGDGNRYGLADQDGRIFMKPSYGLIQPFSEGLAAYAVEPLSKYGQDNPHIRFGYLDTQGKTVIAPQFAQAASFSGGVAWVKHADSGDRLLIDRTGKTLLRAPSYIYQAFENFDANGLAIVKKNGLYGLINTRGESVLAAEYDLIYSPNTQIFYLKKDGKLGVANAQGKMIIPTQFDNSAQWDSNKDKTPSGHIALIRGTTVFLFDANGKQIAQRRARAVAACAHVAHGLPHKIQKGYRVNTFTLDRNHVWFSHTDNDDDIITGTCADVAAPRKKGSKRRP